MPASSLNWSQAPIDTLSASFAIWKVRLKLSTVKRMPAMVVGRGVDDGVLELGKNEEGVPVLLGEGVSVVVADVAVSVLVMDEAEPAVAVNEPVDVVERVPVPALEAVSDGVCVAVRVLLDIVEGVMEAVAVFVVEGVKEAVRETAEREAKQTRCRRRTERKQCNKKA